MNETTDPSTAVNLLCQAMLCHALSEHFNEQVSKPLTRALNQARNPPSSQRVIHIVSSHALFAMSSYASNLWNGHEGACRSLGQRRAAPWAGVP